MLGERAAPTGSMFLGRRVDDTIGLYYQRILDHGERLDLDQLKDAYRDRWRADFEAERASLGIGWEEDLGADRAFHLGLQALELTVEEFVPRLGEPVAVQRRLEYTLAPGLEWLSRVGRSVSSTSWNPSGSASSERVICGASPVSSASSGYASAKEACFRFAMRERRRSARYDSLLQLLKLTSQLKWHPAFRSAMATL
jgi:hypothetical protein